jgi:hypothetical protein
LFCQLLAVCAEAGLVSLGIVAIDGTKVAGNAGLGSNRGEDTIRAEVRKLLDAAAATDAAEDRLFGDRRGDELPDGLNKAGRERLVRLRAAAARVEDRKARAGKDAATQLAEFETKDAESMAATGLRRRGPKPLGPDPIGQAEQFLADARADHQRAKDVYAQAAREARAADRPRPSYNECNKRHMRVLSAEGRVARLQQAAAEGRLVVPEPPAPPTANITDPDSTVMPSVKGWMQGYNVQAAVNDQQLILAVDVVDTPNDVTQLEPMIAATRANLMIAGIDRGPGTILADAGYWSEANAAGPTSDDDDRPDRLIATTKSHKLRRQARERGEAKGPPPADATPLEAMEHRLRTPEGTALYAKRSITVEPVFGQLKERQRLRQFMRRGKPAVTAEATFAATTHNLLKLFTAGYRPAVAG